MSGKDKTNFEDAAVRQGEANKEVVRDQTYSNRPDQVGPGGYTSWAQEQVIDPATGEAVTKWTQNTGLTPELQEIYNKTIGMQGARTDLAGGAIGRLQDDFGQKMDWSNFNPLESKPQSQYTLPEGGMDDPYQTRQRAEDAMYDSAMNRLTPQFDSERQSMEIKLRNQGLSPGDEAYDSQMQGVNQRQTDATNNAIWSSVGEGRNESGQMFNQQLAGNQNQFQQALGANAQNYGMDMQGAEYANQIRQQQIAEGMAERGQNLNEATALMQGQQVGMPQMPSFVPAGAAEAAPIMTGAAQNQSQAQANNPWGAVAGLGGTLGGAALGNTALFTP